MLDTLLAKVVGTQNDRELKRLRPIVAEVNAFEPAITALSDDRLRGKTAELRQRFANGETLVISGFLRNRDVRERANLGVRGGWFGRSTTVTQKRVELLILLTPKVL